ncbi:hypothetical protein [Paraclostridium bifermentans]|uniref:hypothetical protein n=1 Tax=Paraclostridium bifermentans TaxID=1490 RepID=UPI00359C498F
MNMILHFNLNTKEFKGFNFTPIENNDWQNITIDKELWQHLLKLKQPFKLIENIEAKSLYTMEDIDMFELLEVTPTPIPPSPLEGLSQQNAQLMLDSANKDIRLKELEKQNAQSMLDNANKDIELKNLQNDLANLVLEVAKGGLV